ncbi:MAG: PAS domain S-box protein [Chloroflexi bacterium]|nr:PAS domain S-box protein [Chloroflexota bacterium]
MPVHLRVLILEDNPADTELFVHELRRGGFEPEWQRVETEEAYRSALNPTLDIILSDYRLPQFDGLHALQILRASGFDIPSILVSGTIGEDAAVECIKQGAADYLLKDRLGRLGPAVKNALEQKRLRDEQRHAAEVLRESEERYRDLVQHSHDLICIHDLTGNILSANPAATRITGYAENELLGMNLQDILASEFRDRFAGYLAEIQATGSASGLMFVDTKHGERRIWEYNNTLRSQGLAVPVVRGTASDITERKRAEMTLHETASQLRAVLNSIAITIFATDINGIFTLSEGKGLEQVGLKPGENVGTSALELYGAMPFVERTGKTITGEEIIRRALAGEIVTALNELHGVHFENHIGPLRDTNGRVAGIVGVAADITARKQAEEQLRRRLVELEALHTISAALRTAQTLGEALPILLDETLAALETDAGAIWLYHPDSGELRAAVERDWFRQLGKTPMKPGVGIAGTVFAGGQSYLTAEFRGDPLARASTREQVPAGWGGACLPIRTGATPVGVMFVSMPTARPITPEQLKLLESLTEMGGAALHRMRLHEETVRQLSQLQALHDIDLAISGSMDLRVTLSILLEHVTARLGVDCAAVLLLDPYTQTLTYADGRGFRTRQAQTARIRVGEDFAGRAVLERRMVRATDAATVQASSHFATLWQQEGLAAYYGVPLIAKGQVKGVLEVFHRAPLDPDPPWLEFLDTLAGQAAIAVDNSQLFEGLQRSNLNLSLAYDATIEGWSRALDLRDKETEGHTQRVTTLTLHLARAMGFSDSELVQVRRGALLHDIGKMGVPDNILLKPGPLSEPEWELMRKHPVYAYEMLAPIAYLQPALDIPYCHHEKWDGTGYPRGLKGEQIPLVARIFAVVDVWDALCSDRPYRQGWPEAKVIAHIRAQAGQHFDPRAVEAFLAEIGKG